MVCTRSYDKQQATWFWKRKDMILVNKKRTKLCPFADIKKLNVDGADMFWILRTFTPIKSDMIYYLYCSTTTTTSSATTTDVACDVDIVRLPPISSRPGLPRIHWRQEVRCRGECGPIAVWYRRGCCSCCSCSCCCCCCRCWCCCCWCSFISLHITRREGTRLTFLNTVIVLGGVVKHAFCW